MDKDVVSDDLPLLARRIDFLKQRGVVESLVKGSAFKNNIPQPTLTFPCIDWLDSRDLSSWTLVEIGSGNSTLYFANYFSQVISFETSRLWYKKILPRLPDNAKLFLFSVDNAATINIDNSGLTMALIDCNSNRYSVSKHLIEKQFDLYILDNSDYLPNTVELFLNSGFIEIPFYGSKSLGDFESCTSLFFRRDSKFPKKKDNYKHEFCKDTKNNLWDLIK
jgi:hypothetical protein